MRLSVCVLVNLLTLSTRSEVINLSKQVHNKKMQAVWQNFLVTTFFSLNYVFFCDFKILCTKKSLVIRPRNSAIRNKNSFQRYSKTSTEQMYADATYMYVIFSGHLYCVRRSCFSGDLVP